MVVHLIVLCAIVLVASVVATGILGQFWRFVRVRPSYRSPHGAPVKRLSLHSPGPDDFEEQLDRRTRLDAPFAAVFLGFSIIVLATPGLDNAWEPTFLLWCVAAAVRWRDTGPAAAFARLGTVVLLAVEALLVLGLHGGTALPQAGAYVALALVGVVLLYRANELPLPFGGPRGTGGDLPPRRRPTAAHEQSGPSLSHPLYDTLPATQQRPLAQITPITQARRNPLRVAETEGSVVSPPYYPRTSA